MDVTGGGFVWSFSWWKEVRDIFGSEGFDWGMYKPTGSAGQ